MSNKNLSFKEREMPYTDTLQIICPIIFAISVFLDLYFPIIPNPLIKFVPSFIRYIIFIVILSLGILLIFKSHKVIFGSEHRSTPSPLIINGVFSIVRNPMYLGINLIYLSVIIISFSIMGIIIWILLFVFIYRKMTNFEEQKLEEIFGEDYIEYKKQVPKWFPRIFKRKN